MKNEKKVCIGIFIVFSLLSFVYLMSLGQYYKRRSMDSRCPQSYPNRNPYLDKENGSLLSQSVAQDFLDVTVGFSDGNVCGLENDLDGGIPFCPQYIYKDRVCVQVVNAETIAKLEAKGYLKNKPEALQLGEDENPIIIIYTFKK